MQSLIPPILSSKWRGLRVGEIKLKNKACDVGGDQRRLFEVLKNNK